MANYQSGGAASPSRREASDALKIQEFLPYRVNILASLLSQALSRIYADRFGIGIAEWRVLAMLGEVETMTGKAIGALSSMHKTKVSRAVAMLEQRKLLSRRTNREDLRESFLSLTPAGRAMYDELAPMAVEFARQLMDGLAPADRAALDRTLTQLTVRSCELVNELAKERDRR